MRRALEEELETHQISDAAERADTLTDMGIYDNIEPFLSLLQSPESQFIMQTAYDLASQQNSSETILTAVKRAGKIVFALKNYAHYSHSNEKIEADIPEGIECVLTLYHNQLKHGIEVIKHYEDVPKILCYPDELNQVWTNIIHNAVQAMNGKGVLEII